MIKNFRCRETEWIFNGQRSRTFSLAVNKIGFRKLVMLNAAETLEDLKLPPANRLEKLRGKRIGQYSVRINDQFRICFRWREKAAFDVEIVDYHE